VLETFCTFKSIFARDGTPIDAAKKIAVVKAIAKYLSLGTRFSEQEIHTFLVLNYSKTIKIR
jgi:hypothetical protein